MNIPISVEPEEMGLSSKRLGRIQRHMNRYVEQEQLPGTMTLIARRGEVVHLECCGMMDVENQKPMTEDTIFRIYSMTKPITTVAAMMLYEEGLFQLDEPVCKYLPAAMVGFKIRLWKTDIAERD